ncbi:hypothetical protein FXO37_14929 [Capsicum annuum]|nr:hypothetical protein FXO37_14929 [Capsicum annuum]
MEKLYLFWFSHLVILARDVNKAIEDNLLARAEDFDKFNNYPWGYDNFYLTVQYLLTKLSSGTTTLYGFPWAFMLMDYPDEVSHPRMFRWLAAKSNSNIKEADVFNPLDDAVHLLQIVPADVESVMTSYITLGHIDTIADPTVELIKKELAGATAIRRAVRQGQPNVEVFHDQPTNADLGTSSGGVVGVGGRHSDAATTYDDDHVDTQERINMFENTLLHPYTGPSHPSSPLCSRCECEECKDRKDKLFEKVVAIIKSIKEFKSKRYVILYKKNIDIILCLMRKKQLTYREAYDVADRIMDLDFYKKLKDRYDQLNEEALALGVGLDFLVPMLILNEEEMIKYVREERPNPHGKS